MRRCVRGWVSAWPAVVGPWLHAAGLLGRCVACGRALQRGALAGARQPRPLPTPDQHLHASSSLPRPQRLRRLVLNGSLAGGRLPAELAALAGLSHLELRACRLRALPRCVAGLPALACLDLGLNQLTDLPGERGLGQCTGGGCRQAGLALVHECTCVDPGLSEPTGLAGGRTWAPASAALCGQPCQSALHPDGCAPNPAGAAADHLRPHQPASPHPHPHPSTPQPAPTSPACATWCCAATRCPACPPRWPPPPAWRRWMLERTTGGLVGWVGGWSTARPGLHGPSCPRAPDSRCWHA